MRAPISASRREACAYVPAARSKRRRAAFASTAGKRSFTMERKRALDGSRHAEEPAVRAAQTADHEAHRRRARLVARQRERAAVEEVRQTVVAQQPAVPAEVVLVARIGFGDGRRDARRARDQEGVEAGHEAGNLFFELL